jgi:hypothetical protein
MANKGLTDHELMCLLVDEQRQAPRVTFTLEACAAFYLVALLQLACRHPDMGPRDVSLVRELADQVKRIGPATAEAIERGWDPMK